MNKKHIKCLLWKGLWGMSALAFVLAWVSVIIQQPIGALDPLFLFWNALILAALATPIKLDCTDCTSCNVGSSHGQ